MGKKGKGHLCKRRGAQRRDSTGTPELLSLAFALYHLRSCSSPWATIVLTASGQGHYPPVRGCTQIPPLAPGGSLSPGSTGWVSSGSPTLSILITASFSRSEGQVGA